MNVAAIAFTAGILFVACGASARAATEFCPAQLIGPYTKSSVHDALVQNYRLRALGPRFVEGTVVADTDSGWFTWNQQPVQLTRTTYTRTSPDARMQYVVAESPELEVSFPRPVNVLRAWMLNAATHGDLYFQWDAHGKVACDPPDFSPRPPDKTITTHTPRADDPTPGPAPPMATATASSAPFAQLDCAQPFVAARVTEAANPTFPDILKDQALSLPAIVEIYVAVNSHGVLADAWIFAGSGYPAMDQAALKAARASKYSSATSYCRPVSDTYLFRADFLP